MDDDIILVMYALTMLWSLKLPSAITKCGMIVTSSSTVTREADKLLRWNANWNTIYTSYGNPNLKVIVYTGTSFEHSEVLLEHAANTNVLKTWHTLF